MKAKITAQLISGLPIRDTPYEVNDPELRGFQLRVYPSGTKTFQCVYRLRNGRRKNRYVIGRTPPLSAAQARAEALMVLGDVARGVDPNEARRQQRIQDARPTLQEFIDGDYAGWAESHLGTSTKTLARIRAAFPDLLNKKLDSLTAWQIEKWKAARLKAGIKASTVNRELAALRSALTKAVEWGVLPEHPMGKVKQVKADQDHRVRFLSEPEEGRLREALDARDERARAARARHNQWRTDRGYEGVPPIGANDYVDHIRPMILVSMNTGLRRGELFTLRRSDVDLQARQLKVRAAAAKSGKSRFVPLNEEALDVLDRWTRQHLGEPDDLVFPGKNGRPLTNVDSAWASVATAAALHDFRWHDLRHHFASRLVMASVDLNTVRELLGHADLKMTLRYAHLAPAHLAEAVARLDRVA